ncbi:MAG: uroporphyrinogen-III synthase [Idiomarina sp.]|nr:uroporphyrinogen-III synthase [Idiomarina sp.]
MTQGVLLVRPEQENDPLELMLRERGFNVYTHSVVTIEPVAIPSEQSAVWCDTEWDGVVVVSPTAANQFERARGDKAWPKAAGYYAVGPGTGNALIALSQRAVTWPAEEHHSEALLALDELMDIQGQRWLIIAGEGGRQLLRDTLRKRGAEVTVAEVYKRQPKPEKERAINNNWLNEIQRIVVSSKEQASLLVDDLRKPKVKRWAMQCHWVVPSERVAAQVEVLGVPRNHIHLAASAVSQDLAAELTRIKTVTPMPESTQKPEPKAATESSPATQLSRVGNFLNWLIIIVLCGSVLTLGAGGAWLWYQHQTLVTQTYDEFENLSERLSRAEVRDEEFEDRLAARVAADAEAQAERQRRDIQRLQERQEEQSDRMRDQLSQYDRDLTRLNQRVSSAENRSSNQWLLHEAYDRVNVATQRLTIEGDPAIAIRLLQQARTLLAEDGSRHAAIVRQLDSDIELLQELPQVDYSGVLMLLQQLQRQIPELAFRATADNGSDAATDTGAAQDWRSNIASAWRSFSQDLIKIQRHDVPVSRLDFEQQVHLISRLELHMQLAQQFLLRRDQELFDDTITDVERLVTSYFDLEHTGTRTFLSSLRSLQGLEISPDYPAQLISRAMLREKIRELEDQPATPRGDGS